MSKENLFSPDYPEWSDSDISLRKRIIELENQDQKADQQRNMGWVALISTLLVIVFLFFPIIPEARLESLSPIIEMFLISMAGIIAAFFGSAAYMTVNKV